MKFCRRSLLLWLALILISCDARDESAPAPGNASASADWAKKATEHPKGFRYTVIRAGEGASPTLGSRVVFHWTCTANGKEVADTRRINREKVSTLSHLELIPGVVEALLSMKPGERWKILLPSQLGYGQAGYPDLVPQDTELEIDLELIRFQPAGSL